MSVHQTASGRREIRPARSRVDDILATLDAALGLAAEDEPAASPSPAERAS